MRRYAIAFSTLLLLGAAVGQTAIKTPPPPGPPSAFAFPDVKSKTLDNGLKVFVVEDHRQALVSYRLMVRAGAIAHDPQKAGLADMTASMLRNGGTKTRTSQQIAKLVDDAGGSLGASAGEDTALVNGTFLKSTSDLGLELLADIVKNPVFDDKELDRLRRQALSGLQVQYNDPAFLIGLLAPRVVYGRHPYAYPRDGTPETLRDMKREDLVAFHRERYVPAGAYFAIAGDITPAEGFAKAEKYLGDWKGEAQKPPAVTQPPAPQPKIVVLDKPDAVQSRIYVGQLGIARNSPDYIPLMIANYIYGGDFTSRLNMKLRANEGLTYGANSSLQAFHEAGAFITSTFTRTEKTIDAIRMIAALQKDFAANPVTDKELASAKAYLAGVFALAIETPEAVADRVLLVASNGLPADYWQTYAAKIRSTTPEQVAEAVKKYYHPDKMAIAVVGNAAQFGKELATLGPVTTISMADFDVIAPDLKRAAEAAPEATPESIARGKALIESAVKAIGGAEALKSVKDIRSQGSMTMKTPQGAMSAEMVEYVSYPDKYRAALTMPVGKIEQVYDGSHFWMKQGANVREMPAQVAAELQKTVMVAGGLGVLRAAVDGSAEVQALEGDSVLWKEKGWTVTIHFDPQTHRIATMQYRSLTPGGAADVELAMNDFRDAGGVQLPWKETMSRGGEPAAERAYTSRKVNAGAPPETFAKP